MRNQTGKPALLASRYLKYAIGEIILVVIGILIALQINNWNEARKDKTLLNSYYKQILSELELEVSSIEFSIARYNNEIKDYEGLQKAMLNRQLPLDSILSMYQKANYRIYGISFKNKTVEVLQSTGDIKLLPNEVRNALIVLQSDQDGHLMNRDGRGDLYTDMVSTLNYVEATSNLTFFEKQNALSEQLKIKERMVQQLPQMIKVQQSRNIINGRNVLELQNILNLTKELQNMVKNQL